MIVSERQTDLATSTSSITPAELYLDLMKSCLTRLLFTAQGADQGSGIVLPLRRTFYRAIRKVVVPAYIAVVRRVPISDGVVRNIIGPIERELKRHAVADPHERTKGADWPADAETMIGMVRLDNLQQCVTDVLRRGVPGDLIETGVWRGGATILMRAVLKAYGDRDRRVWVADSFRGLPRPNPERAPADAGDALWAFGELAVPVEQVKANFCRYGLLDEQVQFLVGWFRDTLPAAPVERLAVMRLDGDMYESTMDALSALYPKLSIGGYVIVDDYGSIPACKAAVDDYRSQHGIAEAIQWVDSDGIYWQRER